MKVTGQGPNYVYMDHVTHVSLVPFRGGYCLLWVSEGTRSTTRGFPHLLWPQSKARFPFIPLPSPSTLPSPSPPMTLSLLSPSRYSLPFLSPPLSLHSLSTTLLSSPPLHFYLFFHVILLANQHRAKMASRKTKVQSFYFDMNWLMKYWAVDGATRV